MGLAPPVQPHHFDDDVLSAANPVSPQRTPSPHGTGGATRSLILLKKFLKNKKMNDYFLLRFTHSIAPNPAQTEASTVNKEIGEYVVFFAGVLVVTGISPVGGVFVVT